MKITLAGPPGAGKSTIRRMLAEKYQLEIRSTGDFMRQMAQNYGYNDITRFLTEYVTHHPEVDRDIDEAQRLYGQEHDDFVLDAHLGFHCVPDAFKIHLTVQEAVAAQRILDAHRDTESAKNLEDSMRANRRRFETMRDNFLRLYAVDITDPANFDIMIDTSHLSPEAVLTQIEAKLQDHQQGPA